ncbi:hypothetical protein DL762_006802 [Monosporascus cannonballus]|uniref:ABM domain-containing protein n=1 Tax=Monosporascus cannonballus TaxID=155416 RepID=A0ABY0H0Z9_9PEZI|nr:hypothetical protein DL762_006802 [Monosporascus cannonballus]
MAPVTEVLRYTPKEGLADSDHQGTLSEASKTLLQQPGCKGVHSSPALEEDNKTHYIFIEWDSIDSHVAFTKKDIFGPFFGKLNAVFDGSPNVYHASLSPEHPPVLHNAEGKGGAKTAVVELLHAYFPGGEGFTADQMASTAKNVQEFLGQLRGNAKGHTGEIALGWVVEELEFKGEKSRSFIFAIGWDSVEAHMKYRETEHFKKVVPLIRGLEGLKGIEMVHVSTKTW